MMTREKVKEITIQKIKEYLPCSDFIINENMKIKDMKIIDDDASEIIMRIQSMTGSKPPLKMWQNVETVGETIDLIFRYLPLPLTKSKRDNYSSGFI